MNRSLYHSLSHTVISFIQAAMTFDHVKILILIIEFLFCFIIRMILKQHFKPYDIQLKWVKNTNHHRSWIPFNLSAKPANE